MAQALPATSPKTCHTNTWLPDPPGPSRRHCREAFRAPDPRQRPPSASHARGGIAAVYLCGKRFFFPYGRVDGAGSAPTSDTLFGLASVTKVLTTSIRGQQPELFERRVADYAPVLFQLGPGAQAMSFTQLASFTAGINPADPPEGDNKHQAGFVNCINSIDPASLPATDQYSNSSVGFLGQVLISQRQASGCDTAAAAQDWYEANLLDALSMSCTSTSAAAADPAHLLSTAFRFNATTGRYHVIEYEACCPWDTAGHAYSTASDSLILVMANVGVSKIAGRPVPQAILDGLVQALKPRTQMSRSDANQQALAWVVSPTDAATGSCVRAKDGGVPASARACW